MRICCPTVAGLVVACGLSVSWALAQPPADKVKPVDKAKAPAAPPSGQPAMSPEQEAMMKAYMDAATPGKEHQVLMKAVGTWDGKVKSWMSPDTTPSESTTTAVITSVMDNRFTRCQIDGDMPGMGPFKGLGYYGFDMVSKQYQAFWVDSMGTGMMNGTGKLSADGKTMTWTMNFNCPVTHKATVMREVEHFKSDNETVMEMFGPDPVTGKEYKMMEITQTRRGAAPAKAPAPKPAGK